LIGNIVAQEIFAVMQREEAYHEQRYITALRGLQTARSRSVCGPRGAACRVRREDHAPCAATMAQRL
jgi:hypothetical protein